MRAWAAPSASAPIRPPKRLITRMPRGIARAISQAANDQPSDGVAIGDRGFSDGVVRTVYVDAQGQQYVVGYNRRKVRGEWILGPA
jgi:hypothetical protein